MRDILNSVTPLDNRGKIQASRAISGWNAAGNSIARSLESLISTDRLSATAIKDLPSGGIAITAAFVKREYESNDNTNAFTDAEKIKLSGLSSTATGGGGGNFSEPFLRPDYWLLTDAERSVVLHIDASALTDATVIIVYLGGVEIARPTPVNNQSALQLLLALLMQQPSK